MRVLEEAARPRQVGLQHNRHHSAEGAHLFLRELVLWMLLQPRVINLFYFWFLLEPPRDLKRVLAMAFHPQGEGLQSPQREKAIEWAGDRADCVLQKRDLIAEFLVFPDDNHAADHVRVAVQIFRRRMNDHVEAELNRAL